MDLCELQCYHEPNCVSINFKVIPDNEGFHECELNNATHQRHDGQLEDKDGYVYKGAEVGTLATFSINYLFFSDSNSYSFLPRFVSESCLSSCTCSTLILHLNLFLFLSEICSGSFVRVCKSLYLIELTFGPT